MAPLGKNTNAMRFGAGLGAAAKTEVFGFIALSNGRPTVRPVPRKNVRRSRFFIIPLRQLAALETDH